MATERNNVDVLNKPYLSAEEEQAFHRVVARLPYKNEAQLKLEERVAKLEAMLPSYTTDDMMVHLNKNKK